MAVESDLPETISREAHLRVLAERDEAKSRASALESTVKDLALVNYARSTFKTMNVTDPDGAAELALPHLRDISGDNADEIRKLVAEKIASDSRFALLQRQNASDDKSQEAETVVQPVVDPGGAGPFGSGPSPAPTGAPPNAKLTWQSPEVAEMIYNNDLAGLNQLLKDGRLDSTRQKSPR